MTGRPRILLAGIDGRGHLSDEAVAAALVFGLRERSPDLCLSASAFDEERVRRWLEVPAVPCQEWGCLVETIANTDLLVVGCGRETSDQQDFEPNHILAEDARGLAHTAGLALLASACRRPFVLASVTVGPFQQPTAKEVAACLATLAARLIAADQPSARRLAELGVDSARLEVAADLAYSLRPCPPDRAAEILEAAHLSTHAGRLLAVVPPGDGRELQWPGPFVAALFDFLATTAATAVVVPTTLEAPRAGFDALQTQLPPGRVQALPIGLRPEEVAAVLGRCELVVSFQRHGAILAAVGGAAVLPFGPAANSEGPAVPLELAVPAEAPRPLAACLGWGWQHRTALSQHAQTVAAKHAAAAHRCLDRLAADLASLSAPPPSRGVEPLLAPALFGLLARARTASWERERLRREAETRFVAHHRDLVGQIEDRDRLVRCLQAELHAKVGERDRLIRELQAQLAAATARSGGGGQP